MLLTIVASSLAVSKRRFRCPTARLQRELGEQGQSTEKASTTQISPVASLFQSRGRLRPETYLHVRV